MLQSAGSKHAASSSCSTWLSRCGSRALALMLSGYGTRALLLLGMWDLPGPDPSSKATLWMKALHEGALATLFIVQPLDQCLLSCAINAYLAEKQPLHCRVIIVCRPLDQRLSDA